MVQSASLHSGPLWGRTAICDAGVLKLAERGGKNAKKRAVVAVARKLSILLHRLWLSGEVYEPLRKQLVLTAAAYVTPAFGFPVEARSEPVSTYQPKHPTALA
jgi:hypothetical protein